MNKTIPAAILASTGMMLAGVGANLIIKGVSRKNDIEIELTKCSLTASLGLGIKLKF